MSSEARTVERPHYQALDGFRGLAILLVFMRHSAGPYLMSSSSFSSRALFQIGASGWVGVDMFFVLSGFLITGILLDSADGPRYFRNFYIRRALRIFPLFYGVLLLLLLLTPFLHLEWRTGHLAYLFYAQNIAVGLHPGLSRIDPAVNLGHFWSLAVEEQYYLVWPLLIWWLRDRRKIMKLSLGLLAGGIVLRCLLLSLHPGGSIAEVIYLEIPTHCDGLLLGSFLAAAKRETSTGYLAKRSRGAGIAALGLIIVLAAVCHGWDYNRTAIAAIGYTLLAVLFGSLLVNSLVSNSLASKFFNLRFLRFLGRFSYGIYVYHLLFQPLLKPLLFWLRRELHSGMGAGVAYLAIWFGGSIAVAVISFRYFESPFLRMKDRFAPSVRQERTPIRTVEPFDLVAEESA